MTKEELRTHYTGLGWEVQPVQNWLLVSSVEGKHKYDVNVASPDNKFGTAQVVVTDDGGANEEAVAEGFWKEAATSFTEALRTHARSFEDAAAVFAVKLGDVSEADEVGDVTVYKTDGSIEKYVVKRRNDTFEHTVLV